MKKNKIKQYSMDLVKQVFKWLILSIIMGIVIGIVVGSFDIILSYANKFRKNNDWLIYFLPIAGIIISYMYVKVKRNAYSGENLLKSEVQSAAKDIPLYMIPVSFIGSLATTFFGGSAGKDSAGTAMAGTFGDFLARKLKLNDGEQRTLVISGVGAAFGVLYDTPFAGALMGMELVLKGNFHYESLIPAFFTSVISSEVSKLIGVKPIEYPKLDLGKLTFPLLGKLIVLGILFGLVGMFFNFVVDNSSKVYGLIIKSPMIKGFVGGIITIVLTLILGKNYNGLGQSVINDAFSSPAHILHFFWKTIFTAVALGSVFQGGRVNPTFFVGATFGSAIASFFGLPLSSVAALGMIGVFCGSHALPITAVAMAIEYFGGGEVLSIIIVMTLTYIVSGFYDILTKRELTKEKSTLFEAAGGKN